MRDVTLMVGGTALRRIPAERARARATVTDPGTATPMTVTAAAGETSSAAPTTASSSDPTTTPRTTAASVPLAQSSPPPRAGGHGAAGQSAGGAISGCGGGAGGSGPDTVSAETAAPARASRYDERIQRGRNMAALLCSCRTFVFRKDTAQSGVVGNNKEAIVSFTPVKYILGY